MGVTYAAQISIKLSYHKVPKELIFHSTPNDTFVVSKITQKNVTYYVVKLDMKVFVGTMQLS